MEKETIVYGCIRDFTTRDDVQSLERRHTNRMAIRTLPSMDQWPLVGREIFSMPSLGEGFGFSRSQIIHFGTAYHAVEYEWERWVKEFETLLKRMYWVSAIVHLETELSGVHTFVWEAQTGEHKPQDEKMLVHCEWEHQGAIRKNGWA